MRYTWKRTSIHDLFNSALAKGEESVELKTNYEAELFRYALHNYRRRSKNILLKEQLKDFRIEVKENKLTIYKAIEIEIKKTGT